jgi:protein CpxP
MMNKIVLAAAGLLTLGAATAFGQPTQAQTGPTTFAAQHNGHQGSHQGGGRLAKLAEYLELTDDQKAQLKPILKHEAEQVRDIRQNTSLSPEQKHDQIKEVRKDTRPQIMAILTPAQREKLKDLRQHHGQ